MRTAFKDAFIRIFLCLWLLPVASWAQSGPILVYGDSLSAAYGLSEKQGWAWLLKARLEEVGMNTEVVNLSVSGETSGGGVARIETALERHSPSVVVLELGANDGLRGLSTRRMEANLARMIEASQDAGAKVVLLGMRLPPSYGQRYVQAFEAVYPRLAEKYELEFMPFMLEAIALDESMFQEDRLHPTAEAQPLLLDAIWEHLARVL